jgi:hypothetical protein
MNQIKGLSRHQIIFGSLEELGARHFVKKSITGLQITERLLGILLFYFILLEPVQLKSNYNLQSCKKSNKNESSKSLEIRPKASFSNLTY